MGDIDRAFRARNGLSLQDKALIFLADTTSNIKSIDESGPTGSLGIQYRGSNVTPKLWIKKSEDNSDWQQIGLIEASDTAPANPSEDYYWKRTTDNVFFSYDSSRGKWLSEKDFHFTCGRANNNASNLYLRVNDRNPTNQAPFCPKDDCTLYGLTITTDAIETFTLEFEKIDTGSVVHTIDYTAESKLIDNSINKDFNAEEKIAIYLDGNNVRRPNVTLYFKTRE